MIQSSAALRQAFLAFFESKGHTILPSGSLVPNDTSLLFTNAGMVPFKPYFLGQATPPHRRVTTSQRCVRAGGKHNDLDNVGVTSRHHTFFEMLGNFSFGDYFKEDAIQYAWTFITEICQLPPEKLWITVYQDDRESAKIWHQKIGVPTSRIVYCGDKDNFWSMGTTGPCGPCTEIFYDHGPDVPGGPPGSPDEEGDRFVEIWNLVFMQYNQDADGKRTPLPVPCVDTGMGLERMAAVMQGVSDNYDTDQFQVILAKIQAHPQGDVLRDVSCRVIADHARSTAFLMADGVKPSHEGRGYVLRRIMRRALCFAARDGITSPFFHTIVADVCHNMAAQMPDGAPDVSDIAAHVLQEEHQFQLILSRGLAAVAALIEEGVTMISGEHAFQLYDTYGLPLDLTLDLATSHGINVDVAGFEVCMTAQRQRSKSAQAFSDSDVALTTDVETIFMGYDHDALPAKIMGLFDASRQPQASLASGAEGFVVLDQSIFYPEGGGQVADGGQVVSDSGVFDVTDVQRQNHSIVLTGKVKEGGLALHQVVQTTLDVDRRLATACHHSATHLLHSALRTVLGDHVVQKGSLVCADYLRFDFAHGQSITSAQLAKIEDCVRCAIRANFPVTTQKMPLAQAKSLGALALFSDQYDDNVRVLTMGDVSMELCGGTHVGATGQIGTFKIISSSSVASGVRRIVAVAGAACDIWIEQQLSVLHDLLAQLQCKPDEASNKLSSVYETLSDQQRKVRALQQQNTQQQADRLQDAVCEVGDVRLLVRMPDGQSLETLRLLMDQCRQKQATRSVVVLLAPQDNGKHLLMVAVSKDLLAQFQAPVLLKHLTTHLGGGGGGRPDFAQGVSQACPELDMLQEWSATWIRDHLTTNTQTS